MSEMQLFLFFLSFFFSEQFESFFNISFILRSSLFAQRHVSDQQSSLSFIIACGSSQVCLDVVHAAVHAQAWNVSVPNQRPHLYHVSSDVLE